MSLNRNAIYDALYNLAVASGDYVTTGKRLQMWTNVAAQPALFIRRGIDHYPPRMDQRGATKVTMNAQIWIYCKAEAADDEPGRQLDDLITAFEDAIRPSLITGVQNLGLPYVSHCWIEGDIDKDDGGAVPSGQAIALIPVKILAIS